MNNLSEELGITLYGKYEGLNPTGSFKDRGMVMAVAKRWKEGAKAIVCASTGNTSAAAAAYATRAGIKAYVVIPDGKIAMGKLAQAIVYGADIISIPGNFDEALKAVREIAKTEAVALVNSVNPYRLEGQNRCLRNLPAVGESARCTSNSSRKCWKHLCLLERIQRMA